MRPLVLTVEGFKSYREEVSFEFDQRSLFGIVGPTGAGKSSILQAIVFALYGKAPGRRESQTSKLVNTASKDAKVRLTFEASDGIWEVTRVIGGLSETDGKSRRRQSAATLSRNGGTPVASGVTEVTEKTEEIIGLDYQAFCTSVMLPQGEFNQFLDATESERNSILKGIFRLERVGKLREAARERVSEVRERIAVLSGEREAIAVDPDKLEKIKEELAQRKHKTDEIRKVVGEATKAEHDREAAVGRLDELKAQLSEAEKVIALVPDPSKLEAIGEVEAERRGAISAATKTVDKLQGQLSQATEELESLAAKSGGQDALRAAAEQVRDLDRINSEIRSLEKQQAPAEAAESKAKAEVEQLTAALVKAEQTLDSATLHLEELREKHAAHQLRQHLADGEVCPVCEQEVVKVPAAGKVPALKGAQQDVTDARKEVTNARAVADKSRATLVLTSERSASIAATLSKLQGESSTLLESLTAQLGANPKQELSKREAALAKWNSAAQDARAELEKATAAVAKAKQLQAEAGSERRRVAGDLIQATAKLNIDSPDVEADSSVLLDAAKRAVDAAEELVGITKKKTQETQALADSADEVLAGYRKRLDLPAKAPVTQALEEHNSAMGALQREISESEKSLKRSKQIEKSVLKHDKEMSLYQRLVADLTDHKFIAYLLDGRRRELAMLGSEKFHELTGRYRFDDEGKFDVVDVRTGKTRTSDTLSGGETFLASLALALALSEAVAQQGGRMQCFFLDEGFGSLDLESLSVALAGIEKLSAPGRLIGLISHVGDLQTELDDLIILDRGDDGDTRVLQFEGPISYPSSTI